MHRFPIRLLLVILLLAGAENLLADVTGTIQGTVTDPNGAIVVGATVTLRNPNTGLLRIVKADSAGYQFLAVPVGQGYEVQVEAPGFKKAVQSGIKLLVNQNFRADFHLEVGAESQSVSVSAVAAQVETTSTELGDVITDTKMTTMPLNGRSYIDLMGLQAGVVPVVSSATTNSQQVSGSGFEGMYSIDGAREAGNSFMVNGGDVENNFQNGASIVPTLDSIQEFRILTNSTNAEYGRATGGIVNVITKSGTNSMHGSAYEFLRNDKLDAANYFDQNQVNPVTGQEIPNSKKGALRQNQFGGTLGGRFIKNRLFYFIDYQGTHYTQGVTSGIINVPSALERTGNFSDTATTGYPALTGTVRGNDQYTNSMNYVLSQRLGYTVNNGEPYWVPGCDTNADAVAGMCVFPGEVIPQAAWSSASKATLKFIANPIATANGVPFWSSNSYDESIPDSKGGMRVDLTTLNTGNWSMYYTIDDATVTNPYGGGNMPGFQTITPSRAQQALLGNTKTFGPNAVNEFRLNFTRRALNQGSPSPTQLGPVTSFGMVSGGLGIIPPVPELTGMPSLSLYSTGDTMALMSVFFQHNNTFELTDSFSKIKGRHSIKFGEDLRKFQMNLNSEGSNNGRFGFAGSETGNDFADYLLGAPDVFVQDSPALLDDRSTYFGTYIQDSYKATPNLTINAGLRWEFSTPWADTKRRVETFVPGEQSKLYPDAPEGWVFPGDPGIAPGMSPIRYKNFAPRVGVAYSPGFSDGTLGKVFGGPGKTSIRAAFGIYYTAYEEIQDVWESGNPPFAQYWASTTLVYLEEPYKGRNGQDPGQRFPFVQYPPGTTGIWDQYLPLNSTQGTWIGNVLPRSNQYNLTIQRELGKSAVLTLGYVGSEGHHLLGLQEADPGNPQLCLSLSQPSEVAPGTPTCGPFGENNIYTTASGQMVYGTRPYSVTSGRGLSQGLLDFGDVVYEESWANSNFNSFQASIQRDAGNLHLLAAYTYSKSIDNNSGFQDLWTNPYDPRRSRAISAFDITNNFVVSYAYFLPFGKLFGSNNRWVTGWQISGITRALSGLPVTLQDSADPSLCGCGGGGSDFPYYDGNPLQFFNPRKTASHEFFSVNDFSPPKTGAVQNIPPRFFYGPDTFNTDLALHKLIHITEPITVELRAEFFNVFNHAQFNNPGGDINSSEFGLVTSAKDPRIGQMALKLAF